MKKIYFLMLSVAAMLGVNANAENEATIYYNDDFSWTNNDVTSVLGWDTKNEIRMDKWGASGAGESFVNPGWTSFTGWVYARPGFIKISKTGYSGDVVSPAITAIGTEARKVKCDVQLVGYTNAKGKQDSQNVFVAVLGAGKITEAQGTGASVAKVNYLDPTTGDLDALMQYDGAAIALDQQNAFMDPVNDTTATKVWQNDASKFTFTIEGATSATRVAIFGGSLQSAKLATSDPNYLDRVFIDNFKVYEYTTGVNDVTAAKTVQSVRYYNLAGQQSAEPFTGVNIVATTYTDGTSTAVKQIVK